MVKQIQEIQDFLQEDSRRRIKIYDGTNEKTIVAKINLEEIIETSPNLEEFLKNLKRINPNLTTICIDKFTPNGSTEKRRGITIQYSLAKKEEELPMGGSLEAQPATAPSVVAAASSNTSPTHKAQVVPQNFGLNGMGLSMPDIVRLTTKSERYDDIKEQNQELKQKVIRLENKVDGLNIDLRNKDALLAINDKNIEYINLKNDLDKKPMISGAVLEKGLDTLAGLLPSIIESKTTGVGLAGSQTQFSPVKQALLDAIEKEDCTDTMCKNLTLIYAKLRTDEVFSKQLKELLTP